MSAGGEQSTWVDGVYNPLIGCRPVSSACKYCPSCLLLEKKGYPAGHVWRSSVEEWEKIKDRKLLKPQGLILLCSDSDLFIEPEGADIWEDLVERLNSRPDVTFIALTKRLEGADRFVKKFGVLPNLWLGTSAEDQGTLDQRASELYRIPAVGYVLSLQPLLEEVDVAPYLGNPLLKKVIAGCEKGKHARPFKNSWLSRIVKACRKYEIWFFPTRWIARDGKIKSHKTEGDRGSNNRARPSYNPKREKMPVLRLVREMLGKKW